MSLIDKISQSLQLPCDYIENIANKASHAYKQYQIKKRNGEYRTIYHPAKELKVLQRWLLANVIERWPVHNAAMAYKKGQSIKNNADVHRNSRFLLRLDLSNFFPSITLSDIDNYIRKAVPGWVEKDFEIFLKLVCRYACLTIGAPTSPGISNAICFQLDTTLDSIAQSKSVVYTRYADDLFFSTKVPDVLTNFPAEVEDVLENLRVPSNLQLNQNKTRHSSKKGRRAVTGITLSSDGRATISRKTKRYIRSQLYNFKTLSEAERKRLAGFLAFIYGIEPDTINSLILKYGHELINKARKGR